jgi:hypothetical protein
MPRSKPYRPPGSILGLEVSERETILAALEDPPAGLEELRAVLLNNEHEWRRAEGLS